MIRLRGFKGALPKLHPASIPDGYAQSCRNAKLRSGSLRPYRQPLQVATLGGASTTLRRLGDTWKGYASDAFAVPGPVASDRIYVSGDGPPRVEKYGAGAFSYPLALPAPASNPSVSLVSGASDPDTKEAVVFAFTYVTVLDEESQPSPPSAEINYTPGQVIRVNGFGATPGGRGINRRRVYRSSTDFAGNAVLHFVAEVPIGTSQLDYALATHPLQEPLPSASYAPPYDGLDGFTSLPNGLIAAWRDRTLLFCEPYVPHAWPREYEVNLEFGIRGLVSLGSGVAVMTTGQPYLVMGSHPSTMTVQKIEESMPCLSRRGVADMGFAAAYPSPDGLAVVDAGGARIVSRGLFTRDDWQALLPQTFVAASYDGAYVYLHKPDPGGPFLMRALDFTGEAAFDVAIEVAAIDLVRDPTTGNLHLLGENGVSVRQFDPPLGDRMALSWRSKRFLAPGLVNFPWARLDCEGSGGTVAARLYGEGDALIATVTQRGTPARLPGGRLDDQFEVEIEGTVEVYGFGAGFEPEALT